MTIELRRHKAKSDTAVVRANKVEISVLTWTSLFCLQPGQIGIKQKTRSAEQILDILQNIHEVTSGICYTRGKTEKWVAARLIGLSFGDVL